MTSLILQVKDKKQLVALMEVIQQYKITFTGNPDETDYLLSTKANQDSIEKSLKQSKDGKLRTIKSSDLWK